VADIHFKATLIHQATVQRTTPSQSASGELVDSWSDAGTIDCRLVQRRERIANEAVGFLMLEEHRLLCNAGEDVTEEDRIADVVLRADDSSVDAGPFSVEEVLTRNTGSAHHMSLKLERVG
jgi:head-tail adaptor